MAVMELAVGALVGARYRLERRLGEGGMGVVWAAEDVAAGQRVAIKLMKASDDPDARRRFVREGRAASAVRHPSVVTILDVLELDDGSPAIVMELLDGESLRDRLTRDGRLALPALLEVIVPVIAAVGAAHALGVVHRDLKPENIFLARGPAGARVVKVLDFGIAKLTALDGEAARSSGLTTAAVMGTPAYMAPEQVFGESDVDHLADVWAIGLVAYQCASGVLPTQGDNIGQVLKNVVARPFEPLDRIADVPHELSDLVARMLARERTHRPADLREPFEILQRLARTDAPAFGPPAERLARVAESRSAAALGATEPALGRVSRASISSVASPGASNPPTGPITRDVPDAASSPVSPSPSPSARRLPRRGALAVAAAVAVAGAGLSLWSRGGSPAAVPSAPAPPLLPPSARLACPILRASGIPEPAGWLGAAAAAIACERARVILGGRPERTLVPAELLDLPSEPGDAFPADPYGPPGARERSVTAARRRAQAYLDGEVTWSSAGFAVALTLHRADGTEIRSSAGDGRGLYQAVRSAMAGLIGSAAIPKATALEPEIAAWSRTDDVDAGLGVLDLTFAFANNAGGLPDECRRFDELSPRVGELGPEGQWLCAYTLGRPPPKVDFDRSDRPESAAGRATRIRIDHSIRQITRPGDVELLRDLFQREKTSRGRSLLAVTESCLLGSTSAQEALERAIVAVQSEPKNPEGGWCAPWEQLLTLKRDQMGADSAVRAMQAWVPWNSWAWLEPGLVAGGGEPATQPLLRRAYTLSPFDAQVASTLAGSYLASGKRTEAQGVAVALRAGGLPLHDVASDLILVRVETSEARFGKALERAQKRAELSSADAGWVRAQRFEIGWQALELAVLLGRAREVADALVERFLTPEPTLLDSNIPSIPMRIPAICALSSAPARCFARFRSVLEQLPGGITPETTAFLTGAEHYVKQNFAAAARAWRPLLGGRMVLSSGLPDEMVDAFQRTGATDLAEQVDQEIMKRAGELHGATLGDVRAARRAFARGERGKARQLAEKVVKAWSLADDEPPALAEMRRLLEALRER